MVADKDLRQALWNLYTNNPKLRSNPCFCCRSVEITELNCQIGHVVAHANGGAKSLDNTRPICADCNRTMSTKNLLSYRRERFGSYVCYSQNCKNEAICGWFCEKHVDKMKENYKAMFDDVAAAQKKRKVWVVDPTTTVAGSGSGSSSAGVKDLMHPLLVEQTPMVGHKVCVKDSTSALADHVALIDTVSDNRELLLSTKFFRADYGKGGKPLAFVKTRTEVFGSALIVAKKENAPVNKDISNLASAYVFYLDLRVCGPIEKILKVCQQLGIYQLPIGRKHQAIQYAKTALKQDIVTQSQSHPEVGQQSVIDIKGEVTQDAIQRLYDNCFDPYATAVNGGYDFSGRYKFNEDGGEEYKGVLSALLGSAYDPLDEIAGRLGGFKIAN